MNKDLQEKIYNMSNSFLPLDMFYNDIRNCDDKTYNKEQAFEDLEKIADFITDLQQENAVLKKALEMACYYMEYEYPKKNDDIYYRKAQELEMIFIEKAKESIDEDRN